MRTPVADIHPHLAPLRLGKCQMGWVHPVHFGFYSIRSVSIFGTKLKKNIRIRYFETSSRFLPFWIPNVLGQDASLEKALGSRRDGILTYITKQVRCHVGFVPLVGRAEYHLLGAYY